MFYPDKWGSEYDDETLTKDLDNIEFAKYAKKGQISISNWKSVDLSFQEFENIIQKQIVSQLQVINTFMCTEAMCNENAQVQNYAKNMVDFVKTEMLYCYSFWKHSTLKNFVQNRINATLIRTYNFLKTLQINILNMYIRERNMQTFNYEKEPATDAPIEYIEELLINYEELQTFILFFERSYGDIYNKTQSFKQNYEAEVTMLGKIFIFSKLFFQMHPKGIEFPISKVIKKEPERAMLKNIFESNNDWSKNIQTKPKEKILEEEEQNIENYFVQGANNLLKKIEESETRKKNVSYFRVGSQQIQEEDGDRVERTETVKMRGFASQRLASRKISGDDMDQINQKEGSATPLIPQPKESELNVKDIIRKSAHNPYSKSPTNPITMSGIKTEPTSRNISNASKQTMASSNFVIDESPEKENGSQLSSSRSAISNSAKSNQSRQEIVHEFLAEKLTDDLITQMDQPYEPQRLIQKVVEPEPEEKRKTKFKRTTKFFTRNDTQTEEDKLKRVYQDEPPEEVPSSPSGTKKGKKNKRDPEKEIEFDPAILEEPSGGKPSTYKENRGQEVADENLLGNLIEKSDEENQNEEEEDDNELGDLRTNKRLVPNRFISKFHELEKQKALPFSHHQPNKLLLNLKRGDNISSIRNTHGWSIVKDNLRAGICQKQIFRINHPENLEHTDKRPFDSNLVPKHMKYLIRRTQRNKAADVGMNFEKMVHD